MSVTLAKENLGPQASEEPSVKDQHSPVPFTRRFGICLSRYSGSSHGRVKLTVARQRRSLTGFPCRPAHGARAISSASVFGCTCSLRRRMNDVKTAYSNARAVAPINQCGSGQVDVPDRKRPIVPIVAHIGSGVTAPSSHVRHLRATSPKAAPPQSRSPGRASRTPAGRYGRDAAIRTPRSPRTSTS